MTTLHLVARADSGLYTSGDVIPFRPDNLGTWIQTFATAARAVIAVYQDARPQEAAG